MYKLNFNISVMVAEDDYTFAATSALDLRDEFETISVGYGSIMDLEVDVTEIHDPLYDEPDDDYELDPNYDPFYAEDWEEDFI